VRCVLSLASAFSSILCVRIVRLILLLPLISLVHPWVLAEAGQSGGQRVLDESWTFRDGAPEGVGTLAQTGDGFLWLGGSTGLFCFDGTRFEHFHPASGDRLQLEFRAEAFNATNSLVFAVPANVINAAGFGVVTFTANTPRQVQVPLKLAF